MLTVPDLAIRVTPRDGTSPTLSPGLSADDYGVEATANMALKLTVASGARTILPEC